MLKKLSSEVSVDSDIIYMPAAIFFACLGVWRLPDLEQKSSFLDEHEVVVAAACSICGNNETAVPVRHAVSSRKGNESP
jgi:hypothetical protein